MAIRGRALRRLVGGIVVLALVMAVASAGAAGEDSGDGTRDGDGTLEEALLDEAISTLEPTARELWPDTFAGLWGSGDEDDTIHIAFTEDAEEKVSQLASGFPSPELLEAVTLERSIKELEAKQEEMIADRELAREGARSLEGVPGHEYDLDIDQRRNAVVVILEDANALATASFKTLYGNDVIVEEGSIAKPAACTRSDCRYNLRSGLEVYRLHGGHIDICSSAFTVKRPSGGRRLLSAAHCGNHPTPTDCGPADTGTNRRHAGERYGENTREKCSGRVDAERHGPPEGFFSMNPRIFVNGDNKSVAVKQRGSWEGIAVDSTRLCKSGRTSGQDLRARQGQARQPELRSE